MPGFACGSGKKAEGEQQRLRGMFRYPPWELCCLYNTQEGIKNNIFIEVLRGSMSSGLQVLGLSWLGGSA